MSMADRSEGQMTALVEAVAEKLCGPEVLWSEVPPFQKYKFKEQILPVVTACIEVLDAEPHKAKRGDEVEAWIKRARNQVTSGTPLGDEMPGWNELDDLLDDYRLHADTGRPLSEEDHDGPT